MPSYTIVLLYDAPTKPRQPYAAFIAADRLKIPLAAERLDDLHDMPAGVSKRATISLIVAGASPLLPANISTRIA